MRLPTRFVDTVHRIFGEAGREWLPRLPSILAQCRTKWGLSTGGPSASMSLNYLEFTTTSSGQPVALKVGVPHDELFTEMEALRFYNGQRAVRLLDADRELGALLLQRLQPGTMLWQLGDHAQETRIAASIMRELYVPSPATHTLPAFSRWTKRAFHLTRTEWDPHERMPRDLIDKAECAFNKIERATTHTVVLHGDLHHENILLDKDSGWTAIDPKGVIGAPILEVGRFLQNQLPRPPRLRKAQVHERVTILSAELGITPEAVAASGLVDCVLSHCWSFEDEALGDDWPLGIELARVLCEIAQM